MKKAIRAYLKTNCHWESCTRDQNAIELQKKHGGIRMAARRYELSDAQWEQIKDMIPRAKTGRPPKDDRLMLNAMLWLARSGAAWADIPERYGPHQSVYSRFCKWRDDGTLLRIFQALNADADYENLCIDSTSIKAHPQSAGAKKGL